MLAPMLIPKLDNPGHWEVRSWVALPEEDKPGDDQLFVEVELRAWYEAGLLGLEDLIARYRDGCNRSGRYEYGRRATDAFETGRERLDLLILESGPRHPTPRRRRKK